MKAKEVRCDACKYYCQDEGNTDVGECRVHPPVMLSHGNPNDVPELTGYWPVVQGSEWCSKWDRDI